MTGNSHLALLRGVNIGGNNIILKDELQALFASFGCRRVRTYIQSGNVLFDGDGGVRRLAAAAAQAVSARLNKPTAVVVLARAQYRAIVKSAPAGWGDDKQREHNALFVAAGGWSPQKILAQLPPPKTDIETVTEGKRAIFWSAERARLSKTTLVKLAATPAYRHVTLRNHNTVLKLLAMLEGKA